MFYLLHIQNGLRVSFEIRSYTSNILYIKHIKTLVFNYLYYIYCRYNNCLCISVLGGYANVTPLPFMSYRFLFCVIAFCASHL